MLFQLTQAHVEDYHVRGFVVFRGLVPSSLIKDLRRCASGFRESAAADTRLGETAQWQLQPIANHIKDLRPFHDLRELDTLRDAFAELLCPAHTFGNVEQTAGLFFEPPKEPTTTGWHRDWTGEFPGMTIEEWQATCNDTRYFNQANCPLYADSATWVQAGSHLTLNHPANLAAMKFATNPKSLDAVDRERLFIDHARSLPGAVQAVLEPGDFLLYRNTTWHTGVYAPYRRRATIFDFVEHPDYAAWRAATDKQWHIQRDQKAAVKTSFDALKDSLELKAGNPTATTVP